MNDKIRKISNELKKSGIGSDYLVSADGDKKMYTISSEGLKNSLRKIIFDAWKNPFVGEMKIEGRDFQNNYFYYKEGVNNAPDSFVVIRDWEEKLEEIVESSEKKEKRNEWTSEETKRRK